MKSLLKAIARIARAMKRAAAGVVKKTIEIGGKLVTIFVPAALPPIDELEPAEDVVAANDNTAVSENQGIRDLAYAVVTGALPTKLQLGAVTALQLDWVLAMDAEMARRVIKASDQEINAHLLGRKIIRGVLAFDEETIEDYATARVIENARLERALGLDQPYKPKMPA